MNSIVIIDNSGGSNCVQSSHLASESGSGSGTNINEKQVPIYNH